MGKMWTEHLSRCGPGLQVSATELRKYFPAGKFIARWGSEMVVEPGEIKF